MDAHDYSDHFDRATFQSGALAAWRTRGAANPSEASQSDDLWRDACREQAALERVNVSSSRWYRRNRARRA